MLHKRNLSICLVLDKLTLPHVLLGNIELLKAVYHKDKKEQIFTR